MQGVYNYKSVRFWCSVLVEYITQAPILIVQAPIYYAIASGAEGLGFKDSALVYGVFHVRVS